MKPIILAVDDEPQILSLLDTSLSAEGYDVRVCTTAATFREINRTEDISLYLIDVNLADGNGFALVKELRSQTDSGIMLLTGRTSETDHVVGLEIGADDYVTKPFRLRELTARVNAVYRRTKSPPAMSPSLRSAEAAEPTQHYFDGYHLCEANRSLLNPDGDEVDLTTAEYQLLLALLRRRGETSTRDMLMNAIKGRDWESDDRTVDGLVSRLRRKIPKRGNGGPYIRTVHGVGYSFTG